MKTRKLGKTFTKKIGSADNSQKLESSILYLSLVTKGSAGILPALIAVTLPSFVGTEARFSNAAFASAPTEDQGQTVASFQLGEAEGQGDKEDKKEFTLLSPALPNSSSPSSLFLSQSIEASPSPLSPSSPLTSPTPSSPLTSPAPPTPSTSQTPPTENSAPSVPSQPVTQNKVKIEIAPVADPRVQADGRSTIALSGQITDENGQIIREDVMVTLTTSAGKFVGADQDKDQGGFQVMARGGEFTATLQSDIKPQQVRIRAAVDSIRKQAPAPRQLPS